MYSELEKQAKQESSAFKDSLQYLIDTQNEQRAADERTAALRYQQLVDQINAQREPLLQQYGLDTQGAYVNKMMAGRQLEDTMARLGLSTQGFGVSQQMAAESAYGQNLNQLMLERNRGISDIERQLSGAHGEQLARQSELESMYAGRLAELNKYITEATESKYQNVYNQLFQAQQYKDQMAQLALDNAFREKQLKASKSSGGGGGSSSSSSSSFTDSISNAMVAEMAALNPKGTNTKATNEALSQYGAFDNGYQPKGIVGHGAVSKTGVKVKDIPGMNTTAKGGYSIANHSIWATPDGNLWYWDGSAGAYLPVPKVSTSSNTKTSTSTKKKEPSILEVLIGANTKTTF